MSQEPVEKEKTLLILVWLIRGIVFLLSLIWLFSKFFYFFLFSGLKKGGVKRASGPQQTRNRQEDHEKGPPGWYQTTIGMVPNHHRDGTKPPSGWYQNTIVYTTQMVPNHHPDGTKPPSGWYDPTIRGRSSDHPGAMIRPSGGDDPTIRGRSFLCVLLVLFCVCCGAVVLVLLWCCCVVVLLCCGAVVLWCCVFLVAVPASSETKRAKIETELRTASARPRRRHRRRLRRRLRRRRLAPPSWPRTSRRTS